MLDCYVGLPYIIVLQAKIEKKNKTKQTNKKKKTAMLYKATPRLRRRNLKTQLYLYGWRRLLGEKYRFFTIGCGGGSRPWAKVGGGGGGEREGCGSWFTCPAGLFHFSHFFLFHPKLGGGGEPRALPLDPPLHGVERKHFENVTFRKRCYVFSLIEFSSCKIQNALRLLCFNIWCRVFWVKLPLRNVDED